MTVENKAIAIRGRVKFDAAEVVAEEEEDMSSDDE